MTGYRVLAALPAAAIALLNWVYAIFVLNRFRGVRAFTRAELTAFSFYLTGGFAAWIGEMCLLHEKFTALQIVASLYRTLLNWCGLVLIVNERPVVTRQQIGSLALVVCISALWEVQHRIVLRAL